MSLLKEFYLTTVELINLLEQDSDTDRQKKIKQINQKLKRRADLLKKIQPPFSEGEQLLGKQAMSLNEKVIQLLNQEKLSVQQDLLNIKKRKQINKNYINPYRSLQTDGYFYDKRK